MEDNLMNHPDRNSAPQSGRSYPHSRRKVLSNGEVRLPRSIRRITGLNIYNHVQRNSEAEELCYQFELGTEQK